VNHFEPVLKEAGVDVSEAEIEWTMLKKEVHKRYRLKSYYA
jgi:hypothetical protein